jgi:hypothetical protein
LALDKSKQTGPSLFLMKYKTSFSILFILLLSPGYFNIETAAQALVVGDTLNPSTTYVNIPDTILPFRAKSSSQFDIDIDFDGTNDIRFFRAHESSPMFQSETYSIYSLTSIEFVVTYPSSVNLDTLVAGMIVDTSLTWNEDYDGAFFYFYIDYAAPPPWGPPDETHGICTKPDTYIGYRKIYPGDTLYGWFNCDLLNPFRIKSYATSKKIFYGISSDKIQSLVFSVYPNPSNGFIIIRNHGIDAQNVELSVFNIQGIELFRQNLELKDQYTCDLSDLTDGIYILCLRTNQGQTTRKFILDKQK